MIKEQAFAKIKFDKETKIINQYFHCDENWDHHSDYQEMIKEGNFFEASKEQYFLCVSGKQFCYIDGKIQEYVIPETVKLEKAKAKKIAELQTIYSSDKTWKCTLKDGIGSIERDKTWIFTNISTKMQFKYDSGVFFEKNISSEDVEDVKNKLNVIGFNLFTTNDKITTLISNAKTIEEIEAINIEAEFAKINKIITVA
jgi:hypothetical protein